MKTIFDLSQEEQDDLFELSQGKIASFRKSNDLTKFQLAQLCSNLGLLLVTVPMRESGIDFDEQASLFTEMNQTLVELLNKTQAKN